MTNANSFLNLLEVQLNNLLQGNDCLIYQSNGKAVLIGSPEEFSMAQLKCAISDWFDRHAEKIDRQKTLIISNRWFVKTTFVDFCMSKIISAVSVNVPHKDKVYIDNGETCLNKWTEPEILKGIKNGSLTKSPNYEVNAKNITNLIFSLCGKDADTSKFVVQWLKEVLWNDAKHDCWLVFVNEAQGTGKSTLASILTSILGKSGTTVKSAQIEGRFNDYLEGKILCEVSEWNPRSEDQEKLKTLTDSRISIEGKGKQIYQTWNMTNFIFTTNRPDIWSKAGIDRRSVIILGEKFDTGCESALKKIYPELLDWLASNSNAQKIFKDEFLVDIAIFLKEKETGLEKIAKINKPTSGLIEVMEASRFEISVVLEEFCGQELTKGSTHRIPDISAKWISFARGRITDRDFKSLDFMAKHKPLYNSEVFSFKKVNGNHYLSVEGVEALPEGPVVPN